MKGKLSLKTQEMVRQKRWKSDEERVQREVRWKFSTVVRDTGTKVKLLMPSDEREDEEVQGIMGVWNKEEGGCLKSTWQLGRELKDEGKADAIGRGGKGTGGRGKYMFKESRKKLKVVLVA